MSRLPSTHKFRPVGRGAKVAPKSRPSHDASAGPSASQTPAPTPTPPVFSTSQSPIKPPQPSLPPSITTTPVQPPSSLPDVVPPELAPSITPTFVASGLPPSLAPPSPTLVSQPEAGPSKHRSPIAPIVELPPPPIRSPEVSRTVGASKYTTFPSPAAPDFTVRRRTSPTPSLRSVRSARSASTSRGGASRTPAFSRPSGEKALLISAAQSSSTPLNLPKRKGKEVVAGSSATPAPETPVAGTETAEADLPQSVTATLTEESSAPPSAPMPALAPAPTTVEDSGLPPSLGTGTNLVSTDSGLPPLLQSSQPTQTSDGGLLPSLISNGEDSNAAVPPPDGTPVRPAPSPADVNAFAASLVAGIQTAPAAEVPVQKPKGRKRKGAAEATGTDAAAGGEGENAGEASQTAKKPRKKAQPRPKGGNRRVAMRKPGEVVEGEENDDADRESAAAAVVAKKRARAARSGQPREPRAMFYRVNLTEEIRPDDFLGQHVDEATATLKSIVTTTGTDGRVSARGINLDRILRERGVERQKEREQYHEMAWQKKQVLRRQVRRKRNERRAERRSEVQKSGGNPDDEVSADEDDSEFEFEVEPDRLTPPSTPEPGTAMLPEGEEGEEGVEEGEGDGEEPLFLPEEDGEGEWPQHQAEDGEAGAEEWHEEDEDMRDLRAAGFTFRADDEREEGDEAEHDEGDFDHDQWHHDEDDEIAAARANIELSRRRVIERNEEREVVEEDEAGKMVNNASHKKLRPNDKWTWEETEFFYMVLSETGENYGLMAHYFPTRTKTQVKKKGLRENKSNPDRVTRAILNRGTIDPAYLIKTIGYDPRRPFDREQELFAEAKADMERLRKLDSMVPEGEGGDDEGHEQGDEAVEQDGQEDEAVEEEHEDGKEGEDEEEVGGEWEEGGGEEEE